MADGAGSAPAAELGAQLAVESAIAALACDLPATAPELATRQALSAARDAAITAARERELALSDLACTLLVAIAAPNCLTCAQIGDGAAVACDRAGQLYLVAPPQRGEYANQTHFLTSATALSDCQIQTWTGDLAALALLTDGLLALALQEPGSVPHAPFFAPLFEFARQSDDREAAIAELREFLHSPPVSARTADDLTLLLATWDDAGLE